MKVTFVCPACEQPATVPVDHAADWQCPACEHRLQHQAGESTLPICVICGNHELYKKKDFPHWLGMTILVAALILSTLTYYAYEKWWSWMFLIGSAIIDGVMYLLVGDVIVCYRCEAHHRGFTTTAAHEPFEITIGERYRQERIRKDQLKGKTKS
ncbi:MAG: hypothetical protein HY289_10380 [Planctomycetes bacterium]|nr:hypothetical protein [Planctomycetota bacterium]